MPSPIPEVEPVTSAVLPARWRSFGMRRGSRVKKRGEKRRARDYIPGETGRAKAASLMVERSAAAREDDPRAAI